MSNHHKKRRRSSIPATRVSSRSPISSVSPAPAPSPTSVPSLTPTPSPTPGPSPAPISVPHTAALPDALVPPDYAELLSGLSADKLVAFHRAKAGPISDLPRSGSEDADRRRLIAGIVEVLADPTVIRKKMAILDFRSRHALNRLAYEFKGILFETAASKDQKESLDASLAVGLVLRGEIAGRPAFIMPLEVYLVFQGELGTGLADQGSLLGYLARLSVEQLKIFPLRTNFKPVAKRRRDLIIEIYRRLTPRFAAELASLGRLHLDLLRALSRGGVAVRFRERDPRGRDSRAAKATGWEAADGFASYLHNSFPFWSRPDAETKEREAARDLMARGFVIPISEIGLRPVYGYTVPRLTTESAPVVTEFFAREMEARSAALIRSLPAPSPPVGASIVSYADRVFEDALKLQVAIVCGLAEHNKDGSLRKRTLDRLSALLGVPASYAAFNFVGLELKTSPTGGPIVRLKKADFNPARTLRKGLLADPLWHAIHEELRSREGWLKWDAFKEYLDSRPAVVKALHIIEDRPRDLGMYMQELVWLGLADTDREEKSIRRSAMSGRLRELDAEADKAWGPIPESARPLRVQPNLELLLPLNAEHCLFEALAAFADLTILDRMVHFALSRESLMRGFEAGWTAASIKDRLAKAATGEISATVRHFIESTGGKRGEAAIMPCLAIVRCEGLGVREKILGMKGVEAVRLEGAEEAPYLLVRYPPAGELLDLLKKKKIFGVIAASLKEAEAEDGANAEAGARASAGTETADRKGGPTDDSTDRRMADSMDDRIDHRTAEPHERRTVKKLREALNTGVWVRLSYQRRRRWLQTRLVTINAVGRDRVFFIDGDGLMSSLPLSALHEVKI